MRLIKATRGFGLIELLISSSLILFLITGTAHLIVLALGAKRTADAHFAAVRQAYSKLERFKSLPFDDQSLQAGAYEEEIVDPASPDIFLIRWRVEDTDDDLKKIVLAVYPRNQTQRRTAFCLLLCRELEF